MSQFLASVSNLHEAEIVVRAGADILDLKNPVEGALGALDVDTIQELVRAYSNKITISATVGDIQEAEHLSVMVNAIAATGVDIIKVGYFNGIGEGEFVRIMNQFAVKGLNIVIVFFADKINDISDITQIIHKTKTFGCMLDTADKKDDLLNCLSIEELAEFVTLCKQHNKKVGLAGSLSQYDIPVLLPLAADYLGFRGALCSGHSRTNSIDELAVYRVRQSLDPVDVSGTSLSENSL